MCLSGAWIKGSLNDLYEVFLLQSCLTENSTYNGNDTDNGNLVYYENMMVIKETNRAEPANISYLCLIPEKF